MRQKFCTFYISTTTFVLRILIRLKFERSHLARHLCLQNCTLKKCHEPFPKEDVLKLIAEKQNIKKRRLQRVIILIYVLV
uniref:Uncharacterized protein n=1 Tax=Anguilla anguilla TaxID=7936 RepID=A0A0E9X1A0_ANGAN